MPASQPTPLYQDNLKVRKLPIPIRQQSCAFRLPIVLLISLSLPTLSLEKDSWGGGPTPYEAPLGQLPHSKRTERSWKLTERLPSRREKPAAVKKSRLDKGYTQTDSIFGVLETPESTRMLMSWQTQSPHLQAVWAYDSQEPSLVVETATLMDISDEENNTEDFDDNDVNMIGGEDDDESGSIADESPEMEGLIANWRLLKLNPDFSSMIPYGHIN